MLSAFSNKQILLFAAKAIGVYLFWYVLYDLWLFPDGRLDEAVAQAILRDTAWLVSLVETEPLVVLRYISIPGYGAIELVDGCTGLSVIGMFAGFVIAYPGSRINRAIFIPAGIYAIYLINVLRMAVLVVGQKYFPSLIAFTHDYTTTGIFYLLVFLMWVFWVNNGSKYLFYKEIKANEVEGVGGTDIDAAHADTSTTSTSAVTDTAS